MADRFTTTHWSLVVSARDSASPNAAEALKQLCERYWQPLYWHVRRLEYRASEAEDLTQAFFVHVLEKGLVAAADQERGKFRTFLLTALRNFLANEKERQNAVKRGGVRRVLPIDFQSAEEAYQLEPSHRLTPERIFERQWAITVLEQALAALEQQQHAAGKGKLFEALAVCLTATEGAPRYAEVAEQLGMTVAAVKKAVSRLRAQYALAIREQVGRTISDQGLIEDELKSVFHALQS